MNPRTLRPLALALLLGTACGGAQRAPAASAQPAAPTYRISLRRRAVAGERARVTRDVREARDTSMLVDGQLAREEHLRTRLDFAAVVTVRQVDSRGESMVSDYLIERCEYEADGQRRTVLAPGAVVHAVAGEMGQAGWMEVGGERVSAADAEVLDDVIHTTRRPTSDDDVFGTETPQPVGASWPMDAVVGAHDLDGMGLRASAGGLRGRSTLLRRATVRGLDCLEIETELSATGVAPPELPSGLAVTRSEVTLRGRRMYPFDERAPTPEFHSRMSMEIAMRGAMEGHQVQLEVRVVNEDTGTGAAVAP